MKRVLYLFLLLNLFSCKEDDFDYPLVLTGDIIEITSVNATFTAKITAEGESAIIESGFLWGVHENPTPDNSIKLKNERTPQGVYSLKSNVDFLPGKTYYVRAYAKSDFTITYGDIRSFSIPPATIPKGKWSMVIDQFPGSQSYCVLIKSSFTLNNITYFVFGNIFGGGDLYAFNHLSNTFSFVVSDAMLFSADVCIVYNDKVYIFSKNAMYSFNPTQLTFTKLADLTIEGLYSTTGFLIGSNIYVGLGSDGFSESSKLFWKFSITNNNWEEVAPFPGDFKSLAFSFTINDKGYVGGGFDLLDLPATLMNDLWSYEPLLDRWVKKESLPIQRTDLYDLSATQMSGFGYAYHKSKIVEYNPVFDLWEFKESVPVDAAICISHLFTYNNRVYIPSVYIVQENSKMYLTLWAYEK